MLLARGIDASQVEVLDIAPATAIAHPESSPCSLHAVGVPCDWRFSCRHIRLRRSLVPWLRSSLYASCVPNIIPRGARRTLA
jgi:hypothetical protein